MNPENETPQGENENLDSQGTTEAPATGSASEIEGPESIEEGVKPDAISAEEYAKLQKRLQQTEMERNNLRNKQEAERLKALEEQGEWEKIAKENQEKLDAIEAEREAAESVKEATALREKIISEYPNEAVRKAAKALIERNPSNIAWGDVGSEEEAKSSIFTQLDALQESMGLSTESDSDEGYEVSANNPSTGLGNPELDKLKSMSADDLRKILPIADTR